LALRPGTRLGVYAITAQIGEGGMGQVYRARDTKLNRDVALKVLPDSFANDADRLARFTREAQTLASLNHPNIAHIHGLEESEGVRALAMELVEGEDLSQRTARGSMPLDEALPIGQQIADALEAANEQGIIHRDLKAANIKVRPDGTVKVLDFGLAKAHTAAGDGRNLSKLPTMMATTIGSILGTPAYMSPEQATGREADRGSDVWAFECPLAGTEGALGPFWSPDSRTIAFLSGTQLKRMDIDGGSGQILTPGVPLPLGGSWNNRGTIIFGNNPSAPIFRVSATGGEPTAATRVETPKQRGHEFPQFLPDGRHFLFFVTGSPDAQVSMSANSTEDRGANCVVRREGGRSGRV
jgi:serine/threonine protein kinase